MTIAAPLRESADLRSALVHLDLRVRRLVDTFREEFAARTGDPLRGLYISDADVDTLLTEDGPDAAERVLIRQTGPVTSARLGTLAHVFDLDSLEQDVVLICLAPDIDLRYERLYGYLQDDVTRRRPTLDLVARLLRAGADEPALALSRVLDATVRLTRAGLLARGTDEQIEQAALLARPLRLEERIVEYLIGSDALDLRIALVAELHPPDDGGHLDVDASEATRGLARMLVRQPGPQAIGPVLYLQGTAGTGKRATARAACAAAGRALLLVDLPGVLASASDRLIETTFAAAAREALLQDAVLCFDGFDRMLSEEPGLAAIRQVVHRLLSERRGPSLLLGEKRWEPAVWLTDASAARIDLPPFGPGARERLWRKHLNGHAHGVQPHELATRYRLVEDESMRAVTTGALSRAALRGAEAVEAEDLRAAARAVAAPPLDGLAYQVEQRYGWDDIVLPADGRAQLRELCARLRHQSLVLDQWGYGRKHARRTGLTALFAGPPGTGKTMAAEIVAGELGLELYRIDLSSVVSKYIGETEKNLERIFQAADQGDAVLLFDEADALFGKRSEVRDAHDRYANVETAFLLQRLETYEGLAVLTTNLRGNIDEAFLRRLDCVLEFPLPEEVERLAIWRRSVPAQAPLGADADLAFLARKFKLAGGHIRNIALTAAFLAAPEGGEIGMRHLARATRREYQKLGKLVAESDFEHFYPLLKEGVD